ncbi:MAG: aminoglycoside phosphotransferase family protein, partial [Gammaproteobacteria bacterium]
TPLTGGVSSDIWRLDLPDGPVCIKRALPKLKVAADWQVPVIRSTYEVAWMETAARVDPRAVPRLLASSAEDGLFAMEYLDPDLFPQWKAELMAGRADAGFAAAVGRRLAAIHGATAGDPDIAARFDNDAIFHAIRLEPYLEATARAHPDLADRLAALVSVTAGTKHALVHGDVSPKNILTGPRGPVFLDAECAWYGDPAFDAAFCLNHMLLKCLHAPAVCADFLACFDALATAYLAGVDWEPAADIEARVAGLLPGLLLARVDGKSPVEYLNDPVQHDCVRRVARRFLETPVAVLRTIRETWAAAVAETTGTARGASG